MNGYPGECVSAYLEVCVLAGELVRPGPAETIAEQIELVCVCILRRAPPWRPENPPRPAPPPRPRGTRGGRPPRCKTWGEGVGAVAWKDS